jgi:hypothetical protein
MLQVSLIAAYLQHGLQTIFQLIEAFHGLDRPDALRGFGFFEWANK